MSADVINLTIDTQDTVVHITDTPSETYTVNFLEVASVDPRVAQALANALAAQASAEAAAALASTYAGSSILNALIFG